MRRLPHEELHSLYRSANIVRVIESRRLRFGGHVARMEEDSTGFKILTGKTKYMEVGRHLGNDSLSRH